MKIFLQIIVITIISAPVFGQSASENTPVIKFIENKNQWADNILYQADISSGKLFLENDCFTFNLANLNDLATVHDYKDYTIKAQGQPLLINHYAYKVYFEGANKNISIQQSKQSKEYYNYYLGNNIAHWASKVFAYNEVDYKNMYPGITMKVYSDNIHLKYDFIISPRANAGAIQLKYVGLPQLELLNGNLHIKAGFADLTELKPYAYQILKGKKIAVECNFIVQDNRVSFAFPEGYNKNVELVIDPILVFASYTGSTEDNWGYTATYDNLGNLYGGGITFGTGYPVTLGAFQTTFGGGDGYPGFPPYSNGCDISISKFNEDGTDLLYSTYIGGSGNETPHSLIVDGDGNLLIYGATGSDDFPTTAGAYDETYNGGTATLVDQVIEFPNGMDIFVSKLNPDGTAMIASTYIGGSSNDGYNLATSTYYNYGDHARGEIGTDAAGNVYVASSTYSSNFPTTIGALQTSIGGNQDGCFFKLNPSLSALTLSSFIGGSGDDGAYSLKLNTSGEILIAGGTTSSNFPTTAGAWHTAYIGGSADGWVSRISADAATMLAGTYIGTNQYDQTYFVDKDAEDNIYITGQTKGAYTVTAGVYSNVNGKQYITKLSPDLAAPIYSTIYGSGSSAVNISPCAFLVDECENVYVSGWGGNVNQGYNPATGTTSSMPLTPDALDATTDGSDFYFFVLAKNGISLLYGSYFGGNLNIGEHVDGGTSRFDKGGTIYQGVCSSCGGYDDFPVTPGVWSTTNNSTNCNLGVAKISLELSGVFAESDADPSIDGCVPFSVDFVNTSLGAEDYIWDFGDGSPQSPLFEPTHLYTTPGAYSVMLIAIDSNSCNIADTSYLSIHVLDDSIHAAFSYTEIQNCDSLTATFIDLSDTIAPTSTYLWSFGDGDFSTDASPVHIFNTPGEYTVQLIVTDPTSCNGADTVSVIIDYLYEFNDGFTIDLNGCLPVQATFTSNFSSADEYDWDFGDSTTATGISALHTYTEVGTYTVQLITWHCSIPDTSFQTVNIDGFPVAFFNANPTFGIINTNCQFIDESTGGVVSWSWAFGDGGSSIEKNPIHVYTELGQYQVCLTVKNANDCEDTYCREVTIEDKGIADIPSAFSPNNDGSNDVLFVKGFGIARMDLKIFNRWGQLIFESTDPTVGWDGTFRSAPQELEVYVYTLSVVFEDNLTFEKKGNVTLLR